MKKKKAKNPNPPFIALAGVRWESVAELTELINAKEPATAMVTVNGVEIDLQKSLDVHRHSPDGFGWGYLGSGAAQTALGVCIHLYGEEIAKEIYQDFKERFIAPLNGDADFEVRINFPEFWLTKIQKMLLLRDTRAELKREIALLIKADTPPENIPKIFADVTKYKGFDTYGIALEVYTDLGGFED